MKLTIPNILIVALLFLSLAATNPSLAIESMAPDQLTSARRLSGDLKIELKGVEDELAANIKASLSAFGYTQERIIARRRMKLLRDNSAKELQKALQPFGYYHPEILIDTSTTESGWLWIMKVEKGPKVTVTELDLQIKGEGADFEAFQQWQADWPLPPGKRLVHPAYEQAKQSFGILAETLGFFDHQTSVHEVLVDAVSNQAIIKLHFDTGPQFVFGDIRIDSDALEQQVLERFYVSKKGDPFTASRLEAIRKTISSSLYFGRINSETEINRNSTPPQINVQIKPELRERDRYKATLGFGTDTGARLLLGWERRLLSPRGDRLQTALGLQQHNSEVHFRSDYKLPITTTPGRFIIATGQYLYENDDFSFIDDDSGEPVFSGIDGPRNVVWLRAGTLSEHSLFNSAQPLHQTLFVGYLDDQFDALNSSNSAAVNLIQQNPQLENFLETSQSSLVLGAEWDWLSMRGNGYATEGLHSRARIILADESLVSDSSYQQAYLGSHFSMLFGERLKLTLRGELGYTNARVDKLTVSDGTEQVNLSMTQLPSQFRFNAGGTYSVRGYGFEALSNNKNGSNHLLTASTELEYLLGSDWSIAAFADIGNAFNDFSDPQLKSGFGIGVRYYTMVGPIRLDFAYPIDNFDSSLRVHFSLGIPILNIGKALQ